MAVSRWVRATLIVIACALVALVALLILELVRGAPKASADSLSTGASGGGNSLAGGRSAALQEAINVAPPLLSYDYRHLDKDLAAAQAVTTGSFSSAYMGNVPAIKALAAKTKAVVKATVLGASVVDDSNPKQIKVLMFVDQVVKNTQLAAPRVDADRVVLTMQPVGKTWKVAAVDAL
jgi:Mce-associated membrane protein